MELKDIKLGQKVRIKDSIPSAFVYTLVGVELTKRGLTFILERDDHGQTIRREESADDFEAA